MSTCIFIDELIKWHSDSPGFTQDRPMPRALTEDPLMLDLHQTRRYLTTALEPDNKRLKPHLNLSTLQKLSTLQSSKDCLIDIAYIFSLCAHSIFIERDQFPVPLINNVYELLRKFDVLLTLRQHDVELNAQQLSADFKEISTKLLDFIKGTPHALFGNYLYSLLNGKISPLRPINHPDISEIDNSLRSTTETTIRLAEKSPSLGTTPALFSAINPDLYQSVKSGPTSKQHPHDMLALNS